MTEFQNPNNIGALWINTKKCDYITDKEILEYFGRSKQTVEMKKIESLIKNIEVANNMIKTLAEERKSMYFKGEIRGEKVIGFLNATKRVRGEDGKFLKDPLTDEFIEEPLTKYDEKLKETVPCRVVKLLLDKGKPADTKTDKKETVTKFKKVEADESPF